MGPFFPFLSSLNSFLSSLFLPSLARASAAAHPHRAAVCPPSLREVRGGGGSSTPPADQGRMRDGSAAPHLRRTATADAGNVCSPPHIGVEIPLRTCVSDAPLETKQVRVSMFRLRACQGCGISAKKNHDVMILAHIKNMSQAFCFPARVRALRHDCFFALAGRDGLRLVFFRRAACLRSGVPADTPLRKQATAR